MLDLTGANLVSYLLRVVRNIVEKNPRFKNTLGKVTFTANGMIAWNDAWVTIRSVTTSGTRLSPDYYMCTQRARAILAKVADQPGQFVEWVREVDKTRLTPEAGVYYLNVDYFDDKTNDIGLTCQQYKWREGKITNAQGSGVYFRSGIDLNVLSMVDQEAGTPVQYNGFNQTSGGFAYLTTPVNTLGIQYSDGLTAPAWNPNTQYTSSTVVTFNSSAWIANASTSNINQQPELGSNYWTPYVDYNPSAGQTLTPLTDYWYQQVVSTNICLSTAGGPEVIVLPANRLSFTITDQSGYVLRNGIDYQMYGQNAIRLSNTTPGGSSLMCNAVVKVNPQTSSGINPENILQVGLQDNETLAAGQVFLHTTNGSFPNVTANPDGTITIPQLLQPGDYCYWEARIQTPQVRAKGKKWELNSFIVVDPTTIKFQQPPTERGGQPPPAIQQSAGEPLLINGQPQFFLPGLHVAIGDQVIVGDQVAIIVSPVITETYEVFGSKENINFTLEVKSNDLQTSSDLSEMLKQTLLIMGRENTEADGLTVFEATRDWQGTARDSSATAPSYIYTVGITAAADWKVFVPLVTRLVSYEITSAITNPDFRGKLQMANRMQAFGATQFIPSY